MNAFITIISISAVIIIDVIIARKLSDIINGEV